MPVLRGEFALPSYHLSNGYIIDYFALATSNTKAKVQPDDINGTTHPHRALIRKGSQQMVTKVLAYAGYTGFMLSMTRACFKNRFGLTIGTYV